MGCCLFTCSKREKETHLYGLCGVWISFVCSNRTFLNANVDIFHLLPQSMYLNKPSPVNQWLLHALFCVSSLFAHPYLFFLFIFLFSLLLSPLYPSCSVHSLLMRLIWTVSLWALGKASILLLSLKELWERFMHTAFVQLEESSLYKRNHFSFYVKL